MHRSLPVERALRASAPHELIDTVRSALAEHFGALTVDLLMADYGLTMLQPVAVLPYTSRPVPVRGSAPGEVFSTQRTTCEPAGSGVLALLPVTVRGDRLGVLSVGLAQEPGEELLGELAQVAEALGHEILVAERDTDLYLQARRAQRLTLAAEMQWQLLPGRACTRAEYQLGAQLEPAYAIFGDNFDWSTSADHLTLTVSNGMGDGIQAALLTNLAVNAMRNARRAGIGLADQAMLADQAVYAQHRGDCHVATLLLRFDLATGEVDVVDAGSPRLWRLRDGVAEPITFDEQLPLGMFEDTHYTAERFHVRPGDRLVLVSDGVYDVASPAGERYGEQALARAIVNTREHPSAHVPREILRRLAGHRDGGQSEDDAMILCLDWRGR
ncbi:PP2C family protein-serine/threonine phosphatase [Amycolatopsis magusensis]